MPLPENKTPFKTMDIKTALLAASNRKRKATSPTVHANPPKHIKTGEDKKLNNEPNEDEIEIIEPESDMMAVGDCKENTDCNVLKNEHSVLSSEKTCSLQDNQINCTKSESFRDSNQISCDDNSFKSSSDDLNSSNLNSSLNAQHKSELSENSEKDSKNEETSSPKGVATGSESKLNDSGLTNQNATKSKRKKKMSSEEAKKRGEEREQKRKEVMKKKEELNAEKLQRKLEKEKRKLEKQEQERIEKEEKEKIKREKKEQDEKERLQKLKEKEELKKQRQMMQEMKQEEKKKKEEMRIKREEELKKAEEEKQKARLEKEQKEKEKRERNKAAFLKFFERRTTTSPVVPQKPLEKEGFFKPFQVSDDMTLAPVVPPVAQERFNKECLDHVLKFQDGKELYLQILKTGNYKDVRLRKRQRKQRLGDADVIIMDNIEPSELFLTAKLLQFSENVRPPYWGTWRKRSTKIRPRNPFAEDEIFDYSVDSDDEWDEGGPGESLSGTENEVESEDDYEVDNEFFVPHGYLSAEEENEDDDEDEDVENDPEKQKALLKLKQQEFEKERKKKTTELKPIILGCFFENVIEFQDNSLGTFLQAYTSEILCSTPIATRFTVEKLKAEAKLHSSTNSPSSGSASAMKKKVPEEAMPDFIRLIHGNINGIRILKKEFQVFWQQRCKAACPPEDGTVEDKELVSVTTNLESTPSKRKAISEATVTNSGFISKRQLTILISQISTYGKCPNPNMKKSCWYVHDSVREKYGLLDAPIPNEWNYVTSKDEAETSPVAKSNSMKNASKQQ